MNNDKTMKKNNNTNSNKNTGVNSTKIIDRSENIGLFEDKPGDDLIICRCEEITQGEIRRAIYDGMRTLTEIKRWTRTGMGLCQGLTCGRLFKSIVAGELGIPIEEMAEPTTRIPQRPIEMSIYAKEAENE